MTKKDYELIALAFAEAYLVTNTPNGREVWEACTEQIAGKLSAQNPRFDLAKFRTACRKSPFN